MGGLRDDLQAESLRLSLRPGEHVAAEIGVLVHRADRLAALLLHEVLHPRAHLVIVRGELAEFELVERLVHRSCRGKWKHVGHVLLEHHWHHCVVHRRAAVDDGEKYVVPVHQLVHRLHCLGHLVLHVLDDVFDLAAVHTALGVGFVERHAHRVDVVYRLDRGYTGEVGHRADDNLGVGDAAHRVGGERRAGRDGEDRCEQQKQAWRDVAL